MESAFYSVVSTAGPVIALLGIGPNIRLFPDEAPQGVQPPYAVFHTIVGAPENQLDGGAGIDSYTVQIDCYSRDRDQAISLASAIRAAIEPYAEVGSLRGTSRDTQTRLYNYQFDIEWLTPR